MHEREPPHSACPAHAGNLVLKQGENKFFREVTVAWVEAYGWTCMGYVSDAIHWFLHKVNVDLVDSPSIQNRSLLEVPCTCHAPLLNPTPASVHWLQQLQIFPFLNEDTGTPSWMACARSCQPVAYLACAEGVSFKADSMADLTAKKVESGGDRKRIGNLPIGQVQWRWFFSSISSLLLPLLSEFS